MQARPSHDQPRVYIETQSLGQKSMPRRYAQVAPRKRQSSAKGLYRQEEKKKNANYNMSMASCVGSRFDVLEEGRWARLERL